MSDLSRRRFLQTTSLLLGATVADSLLAAPPKGSVAARKPYFEPSALFLTWQSDPTTTMTVQWVGTDKEGANRPLIYTKHSDSVLKQQPFVARPYPMVENRYIYRSELTGLEPGTEYDFRVGIDGTPEKFRTMPAKATNTIHFVSGGDSGTGEHAVMTNKLAAAQSPMFVVLGGDIAYENAKDPEVFYTFLKNYSRDLRDQDGRRIPLLGCIGNHEVLGGFQKTRKEAPFFYAVFDGLFKETGYAHLDFGDYMSLIFLDTDHTSPIEGAQTDWLDKVLKERAEFPTVFVFLHVPAYPSHRPFAPDWLIGSGIKQRKHWVPLFERHNVDAVFEHHDHTFKRTHPLLDGMVNKNGIVYLGDGSWGKIRPPATLAERPYLALTDEAYHLSLHRIEGDVRQHIALADTGRVVDIYSTTKRART